MTTFSSAFHVHKYLLLTSFLYMVTVTVAVFACGGSVGQFFAVLGFYLTASLLTVFFILAVLSVFFAQALYETDDFTVFPIGWIRKVVADFEKRLNAYIDSGMLNQAICGLLALLPLLTFFSMAKSLIPRILPFRWDPALAKADRLLYLGHYPQDFWVPLVQKFHMVILLDNAYIVWFGVLFAVNGFAIFCDHNSFRRMRYLWSFSICWILSGTVLALVFSSCGPVFYHLFYPDLPDPYHAQRVWLTTARDGQPAATLDVAKALYAMEQSSRLPQMNGISAMPSQHVAITFLMALYAYKIEKKLGLLGFLYSALILLGSVVLGWHYAIDGYAGIILVLTIWAFSDRFLRRSYGNDGLIVPSVPLVEAPRSGRS